MRIAAHIDFCFCSPLLPAPGWGLAHHQPQEHVSKSDWSSASSKEEGQFKELHWEPSLQCSSSPCRKCQFSNFNRSILIFYPWIGTNATVWWWGCFLVYSHIHILGSRCKGVFILLNKATRGPLLHLLRSLNYCSILQHSWKSVKTYRILAISICLMRIQCQKTRISSTQ